MNLDEQFPSKWLKASDLEGKQVPVKISHITLEQVGKDKPAQPVIYFEEFDKGLVLNKTNYGNISVVYGKESDDWIGASVILYEAMVPFQGRDVPAIRVKIPPRRPAAPARTPAPVRAPAPNVTSGRPAAAKASPYTGQQYDERNPPPHDEMNDEIPW